MLIFFEMNLRLNNKTKILKRSGKSILNFRKQEIRTFINNKHVSEFNVHTYAMYVNYSNIITSDTL